MHKLVVSLIITFTLVTVQGQIVGSRENSESSPSAVGPAQLTGGGYSGDVNVFNGSYNASYPLGSVSTPGGLNYGVSLNYSPSYSVGETPSVSSGIPYGEGWNVGMPTISVSNASYFSFLATYECNKKSQYLKDANNYFDTTKVNIGGLDQSAASMNGDVFWFSPHVSIPGVASGRGVFKYIDEDDAKCAVFVLNKFERHIEIRFYGDRWRVIDDSGNQYDFGTTIVTYRSPNNARVLNYNSTNKNINNDVNSLIESNTYGAYSEEVLNVTEPKQAFTAWYCDLITNRNIPNQSIQFAYEKFGAFNYFKEFEQPLVELKVAEKMRSSLTLGVTGYDYLNFTAYTDILLTKVTSYVQNSIFEILDLGYQTSEQIGTHMLDPNNPDVERLDSLYAYTTVFSDGVGTDDFEDWNRYYHGKSEGTYDLISAEPEISNQNPYYTVAGNGTGSAGYIRDIAADGNDISFDHAFLESPRILNDGTTLIPGDIYEVRTTISDNNGSDAAMGTGTVDLRIVTGDLGFELGHSYVTDSVPPCDPGTAGYTPTTLGSSFSSLDNTIGSGVYPASDYNKTRGTPIFTTQNQAVKWHIPSEATSISTSNFFVMPSIPYSYDGVNIQIGPGNSDVEYGNSSLSEINTDEDGTLHPSAYNGYSHMQEDPTALASYEDIPYAFGIGMPWSMVAPIYVDQMGGIDGDNAQFTDAYDFWYNHKIPTDGILWPNEPTKFNENVKLKDVEVIRYSKVPYMLSSVKLYRVNGEISPIDDTSGIILIAESQMEYSYESKRVIENYPYSHHYTDLVDTVAFPCAYLLPSGDTLIHSTAYYQSVYTLNRVKSIPVAAWKNDPSVSETYAESALLQTEFEYEWYGYEDNEVMVYDIHGHPGRRTRIMTKYIDQLGGETFIEYYPRLSTSTLKEGRYGASEKCAVYNADPIMGQSRAYDVHPSVHFISKMDEKNTVDPTLVSGAIKRTEYVYDTTQIIFQSFDYYLPENFRGGYKKSYSKGFAKTTVLSPPLETGEQTYTEYYHLGNIYTPTIEDGMLSADTSTIEEYLYFGKIDKIIQYNYLNQIEEETYFDYAHTKAYENGRARPRMSRDNLIAPTDYESTTNWVHAREYEYADYYTGEIDSIYDVVKFGVILTDHQDSTDLFFTLGDTTIYEEDQTLAIIDLSGNVLEVLVPGYNIIPEPLIGLYSIYGPISGDSAKAVVSNKSYLGSRWGDLTEKSAFLETSFYSELQAINPHFYFDSYFVKTTKKTSRSYDNFSEVDEVGGGIIAIPIGETVDPSPFGPPYTNPIVSAQGDASLISAINSSSTGTNIESYFISHSPLSEDVLDAFVAKIGQFNSSVIKNVLVAQPVLSDDILSAVFSGSGLLAQSDAYAIFADQPYLSDEFLMYSISGASQNQDQFLKQLYLLNDYLSDTVMIRMSEFSSFSQNVLKDVLMEQGQLSEPVLLCVTNKANNNADFAIEAILLNQPILTDTIFYTLAENNNLSSNNVISVYINSSTDPSDNALISLLNRTPAISGQILVGILQASEHYFGDSLRTGVEVALGLANTGQALEFQTNLNPYGIYCKDEIVSGRDFVEGVTEYEYYEANFDGTTEALGYKKLLALEDLETDIKLKHQPSWQVFSIKSTTPDYPDAYSLQEYFYYFDLLNRQSRHYEFYDQENRFYKFEPEYSPGDTAYSNENWPADHQAGGVLQGHIPLHDGAKNSQRNNLRTIAFQSTVFTKNNQNEPAVMRSEYYLYDSRWNRPESDIDSTIEYSGPSCGGEGEPDPAGCEDCFGIKWNGSNAEVMEHVPFGYCAYGIEGGAIKCCPVMINLEDCGYTVTEVIGCNPDAEDPGADTVGVRSMIPEEAMDRGMYFRSFVLQIDTIPTSDTQWSERLDMSNSYIMDFYLGGSGDNDDLERRRAYASYPFDTLTVRTVDERNRYTQVQLEHNTVGVFTKYDYETTVRIWHKNLNNGPGCSGYGNYSSIINNNIGMPVQVTAGYGRADSMSTQYTYYPNYSIDSIVNAVGHRLHYTYDNYDRLETSYENGRKLSSNNYHYWQRDTSLNFQERTAENYVESFVYNDANPIPSEHSKAFIDPLGRNFSVSTSTDGDSTQIHSGTVLYDNWGRVRKGFKPYKLTDQDTYLPSSDTLFAYTHGLYENTPKSRTLRSAKYGITDIMDDHTVKQAYELIDEVILACQLNLRATEAALLIDPLFDGDFKFIRVETEDEDGKRMVTYSNAIGQQIATLQYGETETEELITLFAYDNFGNLTTVINPEKQWTEYRYNILGQLIEETTLDAGKVRYMYNKLGLLSVSQDENGRLGAIPLMGVDSIPYYRVYEYDDYGRLLTQKRAFWTDPANLPAKNSLSIDPLFYQDTIAGVDGSGDPVFNGPGYTEDYFSYHFSNRSTYDWLAEISYANFLGGGAGSYIADSGLVTDFINFGSGLLEKQFSYGLDTANNYLGKLKQSISYDANGDAVERTTFAYNKEEQLVSELIEFSATGAFADPTKSVVAKLSYPQYNYRGSLEYMQVDVNNDNVLDFQYKYVYDDWNRLREIYVSYAEGEDGNRVVSYDYDDALGLLKVTKHYVNFSNASCGEQEAQTVEFTYDVRDRLTNISSDLFDYTLFYDNNAPSHADFTESVVYDQNWNGNINGTAADYKLDGPSITNSGSLSGLFDKATIYGCKYDFVNRLYLADAHAGDLVNPLYTNSFGIGDVEYNYDRIGNITNLKRGIALDGTDLVNEEWDYKYSAGTNRLEKVKGVGTTTDRNYTYDANGNLQSDDFKSISEISYARANYPFHISKGSTEISYLYSVADQRMYKETQNITDTTREYYLKNIGIVDLQSNNWTWYVTGADRVAKITPFENQQPKNIGSEIASTLNDTLIASFYLYDHLGNTRVVYSAEIQCPSYVAYTIDYAADYYPYGKTLREFITGDGAEKFLTTQHERDQETGLDYRGARFYDSDIARFLSLDPLAADYPSLSDYAYVAGNPVLLVDANGKEIGYPEWMEWVLAAYYPAMLGVKVNELYGFDDTWIGKFEARLAEHVTGEAMIESVVGLISTYANNPYLSLIDLFAPGSSLTLMLGDGAIETINKAFTEGDPAAWADITVAIVAWKLGGTEGEFVVEKTGAQFDKMNLGEAVVTKLHHNWSKIFGDKKVTMSDVEPYVNEALANGQWQTTGTLRGKGGVIVGEKLELVQQVDGYIIWVGGIKNLDGTITVNNAAVQ